MRSSEETAMFLSDEQERIIAELVKMHQAISEKYTAEDWRLLMNIPWWKQNLEGFEDEFQDAWLAGEDCLAELDALKQHWREGLLEITGCRRAA
jgi:hypothetical protein